jgi:hypothetical protein
MRSPSAIAEGFKLLFRRPSIALGEIAWRWSFAASAWFLIALFLTEYAGTLPVNSVDRLLLGTQQPALAWRAIQRIFHGSALRFTESGILLALAMTVAWIILASFGRLATLKAILVELGVATPADTSRSDISSLLALNFLRAGVALAALVAGLGAVLLASGIWASTHLSLAAGVRFCVTLCFLAWISWAVLNWVLSTSALFVVANRISASAAVSATVGWGRIRLGSVVAAGICFSLVHGGALIAAWGAAFTVFGMAQLLGAGRALFLEFLIAAVYFAIADVLYIGRMSAYLAIIHGEQMSDQSQTQPMPFPGPGKDRDAIDQSELILSDFPLPAT